MRKELGIGVLVVLLCGCASMRQKCRTVINHPDGTIEVREVEARGSAFWDAKGSLDKLRVSNGSKTQSIGLSGVESEVSSTNIAAEIEALTRLLQTLKTP